MANEQYIGSIMIACSCFGWLYNTYQSPLPVMSKSLTQKGYTIGVRSFYMDQQLKTMEQQ